MTMQSEAEILKDIMASETEVEDGETVELDDDSGDVVENDDGSAVVKLDDEGGAEDNEFYANLAETLPMRELQSISVELDDLISRDRKAREKRDEKYEEGIRRTGLGDDAPGGASFEGASKVVHPMLVEACIDFAARAIKELFPPGGPAKDNIIGEVTAEKTAKSKRKTKFLNWQFTQQMPEFRAELEQMLTQVPMGGVQYLKLTWDAHKRRPTGEFVAVDDVFLPFAATNFYASNRKTHRQYLTRYEYERRVRTGMYLDADLPRIPIEPDVSRTETANQRVEGKEASAYNEDGLREVLEISVSYEITDTKRKSAPPERNVISEQGPAPYLITMDSSSKRILAVYRNWEEQDETEEDRVPVRAVAWRVRDRTASHDRRSGGRRHGRTARPARLCPHRQLPRHAQAQGSGRWTDGACRRADGHRDRRRHQRRRHPQDRDAGTDEPAQRCAVPAAGVLGRRRQGRGQDHARRGQRQSERAGGHHDGPHRAGHGGVQFDPRPAARRDGARAEGRASHQRDLPRRR
jgi:hypothetical protein